jgi:hypothetical protein
VSDLSYRINRAIEELSLSEASKNLLAEMTGAPTGFDSEAEFTPAFWELKAKGLVSYGWSAASKHLFVDDEGFPRINYDNSHRHIVATPTQFGFIIGEALKEKAAHTVIN